ELDQLRNFFDGLINSSNVFESRFIPLFGQEAGLAFAETERAFAGHFDLPYEEEINEQRDDDKRQHADRDAPKHGIGFAGLEYGNAQQLLLELRIQPDFRAE